MPGIGGVFFGWGVLPVLVVSGMPGIFPVGTLLALAGLMPGAEFAFKGTELVENSGGIFAESILLAALPLPALTFVVSGLEQAKLTANRQKVRTNKILFNIKIKPQKYNFKNSCAGLKVASLGVSDGVQTGTGRYQTKLGRLVVKHGLNNY